LAQLKLADNFEAGGPMLPTKTEKIKANFECREEIQRSDDAADQN
jgi:hypothetical protein